MVESQAIFDSFVKSGLWLICDVNILFAFDSQDLVIMVNLPVHDSVSESLGYNELYIFGGNVKFLADVFKGNSAVSNGNSPQTYSDNDLVKSQNDVVEFISLEGLFILFDDRVEVFELSFKDYLNQFVVRVGVFEVELVCENLSVGNLSLQKFNYNGHFLALNFESLGIVRRLSDSLVESGQSVCVLPSDSLDSASVKQILAELVVGL